jgi:NAD(P)-dependent dehydrogenase (short-subunit alcohol dehydrogenase family)
MKKVAVVSGANKGIGLEACRQLARAAFHVVMTARNETRGQNAYQTLIDEGLDVDFHQLDVTSEESVEALRRYLEENFGQVDVLVNNAGILSEETASSGDIESIHRVVNTNLYGTIRLTTALLPLIKASSDGRIINVSSGMGSMEEMEGGYAGYRLSKVGLNAYTIMLSKELIGSNVKVNSMSPGWVNTDMGGSSASRSTEEGADTITWLATIPQCPSGRFFRDRRETAF